MDIDELKRRAGITERTYNMVSTEDLATFLDDEYEFLGKLGTVIGRTMQGDQARQLLRVIGDRRQRIQTYKKQTGPAPQKPRDDRGQAQAAGAYADMDAADTVQRTWTA